MTTRTSASLKQAFKRFVELVKPIDDVRHVVAFDDEGEVDFFTYIKERDRVVMSAVYRAEDHIILEFPDLPVDFHVRYLEGRTLSDLVHPLPPLAFSRQE